MTVLPPKIHMFSCRAVSLRNACTGPSPSASATCSLSASRRPMKEKFSGRHAISAPEVLGFAQQFARGHEIVCDHVARGHLNGSYDAHYFGASAVAAAASALLIRSTVGLSQVPVIR